MLNAFAYNQDRLLYLAKPTFHQRLKSTTYTGTLKEYCMYNRPTGSIIKSYCYVSEDKESMHSFLLAAKGKAIRKHFTLKNYSNIRRKYHG